jgi:hypothetical protein
VQAVIFAYEAGVVSAGRTTSSASRAMPSQPS